MIQQYSILSTAINYYIYFDLLPLVLYESDFLDGLNRYLPLILYEIDLTSFLVEGTNCFEYEAFGYYEHYGLSGAVLILFYLVAMELIAIEWLQLLQLQVFIEKGLPLGRKVLFYQVCHYEIRLVRVALKL